jgi:hypothetical protein
MVLFATSISQWLRNNCGVPEYPIHTYQASGWGVEEFGLPKEDLDAFWKWVYESYEGSNFWLKLKEIEPGIVERFTCFNNGKFVVYFCTTREDTMWNSAQFQSHRWLEKHGWDSPNVVVSEHKGDFCYSVGASVFLDDKFSNCEDVSKKSPGTVVVWLALPSQRKYMDDAKKIMLENKNFWVISHVDEFFELAKWDFKECQEKVSE